MSDITIKPDDKLRLDRLRARAKRDGLGIHKARGQTHLNNRGGLMIFDLYRNAVIYGDNFDLTVAEAEDLVSDLVKAQQAN